MDDSSLGFNDSTMSMTSTVSLDVSESSMMMVPGDEDESNSETRDQELYNIVMRSRSLEEEHYRPRYMAATVIADNIHGHIKVPGVLMHIIDTEQFDRLRSLKQVGPAHYVYPAAKHSR